MFLGSTGRNESNSHQDARIGRRKFFMNSRYIMSRKWVSNLFGLRRPNKSNSHQLARNGEKKIFDEHDVDHV